MENLNGDSLEGGKVPLVDLKREYRAAIDGTHDERYEALRARRYYDGEQWTKSELKVLRDRKQPIITINRSRRKVNGLVGYEIRRRTDPIALPKDEKSGKMANTASKVMRSVEESIKLDKRVTRAFRNLLVEGSGIIEMGVEQRKGKYYATAKHVPWEMFYHDPRSRDEGFEDCSYMGLGEWMSIDEAESRWPEHEDLFIQSEDHADGYYDDEASEDRPRYRWYDETRKRVRVIQHWRRQGKDWYYYTFTGAGIMEEGKSPYVCAQSGNTYCPLYPQSCYIDQYNQRYGIMRDLFSPQDEINQRRSKLLHKISEKQFFYTKGSVSNPAKIKNELKKPDGVIEIEHGQLGQDFGVLEDRAGIQGQVELLQEAKGEIDVQGLNPTLLGRTDGAVSGRAILASQDGALAEEALIFEQLSEWKVRLYHGIWNIIKQFYTDERDERISGDDKATKFIGINKTLGVACLLYTSPSPRDRTRSRMPSSA